MLERIGPDNPTISRPAPGIEERIASLLEQAPDAAVAEIGVGIGATTQAIAKTMKGRGKLHIFDFQDSVDELKADLNGLGFFNVVAHGNTRRHWDSYHWSLAKLLDAMRCPIFDYAYLDGSHLLLHDLPAFVILDKLVKPGGFIEFDDYGWKFENSTWMKATRHEYITDEHAAVPNIKMLVDLFVKGNPNYRMVTTNRLFQRL
ncbi:MULTISPECIES: class I SAM-dependent methyltransferase [Aminobacter]|jgi:predicted O-methyltransferase YrrM|uniref:O-methyltransferase YrrM n=2 Tax=Aminobacter TaxID=31988 RepID=A0AAC9ATR2_AMIAI|nr:MULTISPECIES: class I SAM-dependent methyltransferase [Aminobacter]AMS44701.1 hypothetical protein AA2016_5796 [Aminobacter aminovorans]MBB3704506.1 putative O-methyltransferase YrrM [Aminobacter aminovorans]MBB6468226.1 putative O-methyltransferase YrrM [Aminobacter lissarensis]MBE1205359.1 class I SAM-dependent methyltransferase [Aminobacter carboxidus]